MNRLSYFKVGIFVIVATVIGVFGIIVLGVGTVFEKHTLVETYIEESVQGLDVGSPVKFRGVLVGKVEKITLTSVVYNTRRRYVLVRAGIDPDMFRFPIANADDPKFISEIQRGLRVRLASQGLTGAAYLEADYLDPARTPPLDIDWEPAYPYVPSARSRITQLAEGIERILQGLEKINVEALVKGIETSLATITKVAEGTNFDKIGAQASAFLSEVRETNRQLGDLVAGVELKSAVTDASAAAKSARQIIERAEKPLSQLLADLPQASESLSRLATRLDAASADLPETGAQLRQTLRGLNRLLAGQQREIQATVENMRRISENMKAITDESTRYPSQVLFGAPPPRSEVMGK